MAIRFLDLFAGIGGFRQGLMNAGGFECVGHCEIDRYAQKAYEILYDTEGEVFYEDARKINPNELPDIDLICAGFPCQSFSVAGRRLGFDDVRGTMFFEIARIAAVKKPAFLLLENVPGLLSHDEGRTFEVILNTLDELGYDVAWQVFNSANYFVPQSRNRVFIVGYCRGKCSGQILCFPDANPKTVKQVIPGKEGDRVYSHNGLAITLTANAGGFSGKTGAYIVPMKSGTVIDGDCIKCIDYSKNPTITEITRCVTARQDSGIANRKGEHSGIIRLETDEPRAIISPDRQTVRQQGRRIKEPDEPMFTLTATDRHGVVYKGSLRKLTPRECFRLQGFSDTQFDKLINAGFSDSRLYKLAGNAVTVNVVECIGKRIKYVKELNEQCQTI